MNIEARIENKDIFNSYEFETAVEANEHDEGWYDTGGKVVKPLKDVKDEVCPDNIDEKPSNQSVSLDH